MQTSALNMALIRKYQQYREWAPENSFPPVQIDSLSTSPRRRPPSLLQSKRFRLALICFLGSALAYSMRSNLSMAIVCMVGIDGTQSDHNRLNGECPPEHHQFQKNGHQSDLNSSGNEDTQMQLTKQKLFSENAAILMSSLSGQNNTDFSSFQLLQSDNGPEHDKRTFFQWSKSVQGTVLSAFFWGYLTSQILGGYACSLVGPKRVILASIMASSLLSLVSPFAARLSVWFLIAVRVLIGFVQGVLFPAMHSLWAGWAPPLERGLLTGVSYAGCQVGNVLVMPLTGLLCRYGPDGGWPSVFYLLGSVGFAWCALWVACVADRPQRDKRLCAEERNFIVASLLQTRKGTQLKTQKGTQPKTQNGMQTKGRTHLQTQKATQLERESETQQTTQPANSSEQNLDTTKKTLVHNLDANAPELHPLLLPEAKDDSEDFEQSVKNNNCPNNGADLVENCQQQKRQIFAIGSRGNASTKTDLKRAQRPPYWAMVRSPAIWAIFAGHFAGDWGAYTMAVGIPSFLKDVLGLDPESMGAISALPYVLYFVMINAGGLVADKLQQRQILSTLNTRRLAMLLALGLQALLLMVIGFSGCGQQTVVIVLLTLSVGVSGLQYSGYVVNYLDISPGHAGLLIGVGNTLSCMAGVLSPLLMGRLTPTGTKAEWLNVFYVSAAVLISGAILFCLLARGDVQPWAVVCNEEEWKDDDEKEKEEQEQRIAVTNIPSAKSATITQRSK